MLPDVEKGNNLMLTRLTPVATLILNSSQQPLALARKYCMNVFVIFVQ